MGIWIGFPTWDHRKLKMRMEECTSLNSSVGRASPVVPEVLGSIPGPTLHFFLPVTLVLKTVDNVDITEIIFLVQT